MRTKRHRTLRRKSSKKMTRKHKEGRKWTTLIDSGQKILDKIFSIESSRKSLGKQAFKNTRKVFGTVIK